MVYKLKLKNNKQNFNSREQFLHLYLRNNRTDYFDFREYYTFQTMKSRKQSRPIG